MSHFSKVKVAFTDTECLVAALAVLGLQGEVHENSKALRDYRGNPLEQKCNVIVGREQFGEGTADIGFVVDEDVTKTECHVDPYQNRVINRLGGAEAFTRKVTQEFAVAKLTKQAAAKGKVLHRVNQGEKVHCFVSA